MAKKILVLALTAAIGLMAVGCILDPGQIKVENSPTKTEPTKESSTVTPTGEVKKEDVQIEELKEQQKAVEDANKSISETEKMAEDLDSTATKVEKIE